MLGWNNCEIGCCGPLLRNISTSTGLRIILCRVGSLYLQVQKQGQCQHTEVYSYLEDMRIYMGIRHQKNPSVSFTGPVQCCI